MTKKNKRKKRVHKEDLKDMVIRVNRKLNRDESLIDSTGWVSVNKRHKSKKDYTRKDKHKKVISPSE